MKVVIDNNIVIDAMNPNPIFEADALQVLKWVSQERIDGFVCANSLTDIFYVLRKTRGIEYAKAKTKGLMCFTRVISLTEDDCKNALILPMSDFEDAIIIVSAQKINADYIVTRDERLIKTEASVRIITPRQLISEF